MTEPAITYRPIGVVRTPFTRSEGTPIQSVAATGIEGTIELDPELAPGLADLDGFSHLVLVTHLHRVGSARLTVTPFLDDRPHGIFATRSPARPNPIGLSVVRLLAVEGSFLRIADLDLIDGTPLLDIKPYVPELDDRAGARIGWFAERLHRLPETRADGRFGAG
ncbi:MAG: tRNA (N6-threonylcarbamoyladenosine(37)-N6)-methyltransferase TrmO [Chloroflexota bacterium]